MSKVVWKQLRSEDLAAFRRYLEGLPPEDRPVYGLLGVKASWWTRLGGGARPFVALFRGERVTLSKLSVWRHRQVTRRDFRADQLKGLSVRRGPLLESAQLSFADGYHVRVGSLPRHQSEPVERFLVEGAAAFDPDGLSARQLTNTFLACEAMGLLPGGIFGGDPGLPQS